MAGTDATAPNVFPGFSLHEDLFYLVKAGLTPLQALQAATAGPAEFLGRSTEQGTIQAGKRADLGVRLKIDFLRTDPTREVIHIGLSGTVGVL
jgi:imidazolonepropionase-like amidohydrolase